MRILIVSVKCENGRIKRGMKTDETLLYNVRILQTKREKERERQSKGKSERAYQYKNNSKGKKALFQFVCVCLVSVYVCVRSFTLKDCQHA